MALLRRCLNEVRVQQGDAAVVEAPLRPLHGAYAGHEALSFRRLEAGTPLDVLQPPAANEPPAMHAH